MAAPSEPDPRAASRAASAGPSLHPGQLDHLGKALLHLARELWVVRDRLAVLEAVLEERGIPVTQAIQDFQPSGEIGERLARERARFTRALVAILAVEDPAA